MKNELAGKKLYAELDGQKFWVQSGLLEWQMALLCFGVCKHGEHKLHFWRRFVECVWPDPVFVWDEWSDLFFGAVCGASKTVERVTGKSFDFGARKWWQCVIFTGAASTGKSARAAMWILGNWLCAQEHTACILTSTSVEMLSRRIWNDILEWIAKANVKFPLRSIPSDLELRWNDSDRKHAIFGVAVKSGGNPQEAVDRIKGVHAPRTFAVIDEMTAVAPAIVSAFRNIRVGTKESQMIGLGNAISKTDPHGERSEPLDGWNGVGVEDKFWLTQYGCCVHFDVYDSPAMADPARYHFYPNKETIEQEASEKGGLNSPEAWSTLRGFWPPSGLSTTVMDEALLDQFNCRSEAVWKGLWEVGAAGDPAFEGGDVRVFYPFRWGAFSNGVIGVELLEPKFVEVDMTQDKRWIHYQISDGYENLCKEFKVNGESRPIPPEHFIMDVTGEGGGLFAILSGRWSDRIQSVEFGGAAEKAQIEPSRPVTYYEKYGNKVTMLYYVFRRFVEGGQIRGLKHSRTIKELCSRDKKMVGGKTQLLKKAECKKLLGSSPDYADGAVLISEFLRRKGVVAAGSTGGGTLIDFSAWNAMIEKRNRSDERGYTDESSNYAA